MRTRLARAAAAVLVLPLVCALFIPQAASASTRDFDPGYIISDDSFFNSLSMTQPQIQAFLEARTCIPKDNVPCLADYRQDTVTQPAEFDHCGRYQGERSELASRIIASVARACMISPEVLLTLVQKEQSLVTRPSAYGYQRATGYACPDTAACDSTYFGFFNQVYNAAWQFREYGASDDWRYHVGRVAVQYSPNTACGSSVITIRNQATANLYNYTPYQPNADTLANPKAPPTECSTYGNLNFSRIYTEWFGDPTATRMPDWWGGCLIYVGGVGCDSDPTHLSIP
jgi:hypothetical protein